MKRTARSLAESIFLFALAGGALRWTYFLGDYALGAIHVLSLGLTFAAMGVCWLFYFCIFRKKKSPLWITVPLVLATLAIYPLLRQPWNPGTVFLAKFESIEAGMSDRDVERIMNGYLGGNLRETSAEYIPEELLGDGVTHSRAYRWTDSDWRHDADVGQVFLREGTVIGTRFASD